MKWHCQRFVSGYFGAFQPISFHQCSRLAFDTSMTEVYNFLIWRHRWGHTAQSRNVGLKLSGPTWTHTALGWWRYEHCIKWQTVAKCTVIEILEYEPGSLLANYVSRDWSQTLMSEYIWPRNYSGIKLYFCWVVKISKLQIKQQYVLLCNVISRKYQTDSHNCLIDDMNFTDSVTISNICAGEPTLLEPSSPFRIHILVFELTLLL